MYNEIIGAYGLDISNGEAKGYNRILSESFNPVIYPGNSSVMLSKRYRSYGIIE
jgi:hypothetical protein